MLPIHNKPVGLWGEANDHQADLSITGY
jgi:hypothetical protein